MFESIANALNWLPSDAEFGIMQTWLSNWISTHLIASVIIYEIAKFIVKKTPWAWDNKALDWVRKKLGFGKDDDVIELVDIVDDGKVE